MDSGAATIVVGIDGSPSSHVAMTWAADQARQRHARLVAVHAWESPIPTDDPRSVRLARNALQTLDAALDHARQELLGLEVDRIAVRGEASRILLDAAAHASLLVLARTHRPGDAPPTAGGVRRRCAERSPCPVVMVPAPGDPPG